MSTTVAHFEKKHCWHIWRLNFRKYKIRYLFVLPGLAFFLIFNYYPLYFLQIAFKDYNIFTGVNESPWVGLQHFITLFTRRDFLQAFGNTVTLSLMYKIFGFPVPIILALLLNEISSHFFKRTTQSLLYLPHFLSWVIVGGIWNIILSPNGGLVNEIISLFGGEPIFFMSSTAWIRWILLLTYIWKSAGWGTIIYLAVIAGIDPGLYESAIIDGANVFQRMINITLPSMLSTILVVFTLSLASVLNLFEQVFVMYNPVVQNVTETIDTYVYIIGIQQSNFTIAAAAGIFKSLISLALVMGTNRLVKKLQGFSMI